MIFGVGAQDLRLQLYSLVERVYESLEYLYMKGLCGRFLVIPCMPLAAE